MYSTNGLLTNQAPKMRPPCTAMQQVKELLHDASIAAVVPPSAYTGKTLTDSVDFSKAKSVIEFAPGEGTLTRQILSNMNVGARLFAVESDQVLCEVLQQACLDPRLTVFHEEARNLFGAPMIAKLKPDVVVSGIPLGRLRDETAARLLSDIARALPAEGRLVIYQAWLPPFLTLRRCKRLLSVEFEIIDEITEFRNLPPLKILVARPRRR